MTKHPQPKQKFNDVFPNQTPITLAQIAKDLDRNLVVLQRWARQGRFRNMLDTTLHPHQRLVPLSEIALIAAIPRGSGNTPKPWKTRAAKLLREGHIHLLSQDQQDTALDQSALKYVAQPDGSYAVTPLARPSFIEDEP